MTYIFRLHRSFRVHLYHCRPCALSLELQHSDRLHDCHVPGSIRCQPPHVMPTSLGPIWSFGVSQVVDFTPHVNRWGRNARYLIFYVLIASIFLFCRQITPLLLSLHIVDSSLPFLTARIFMATTTAQKSLIFKSSTSIGVAHYLRCYFVVSSSP